MLEKVRRARTVSAYPNCWNETRVHQQRRVAAGTELSAIEQEQSIPCNQIVRPQATAIVLLRLLTLRV